MNVNRLSKAHIDYYKKNCVEKIHTLQLNFLCYEKVQIASYFNSHVDWKGDLLGFEMHLSACKLSESKVMIIFTVKIGQGKA